MKVFIWTGGHTMAESFFQNPPSGVQVVTNIDSYITKAGASGERIHSVPNKLKKVVDGTSYRLGFPRLLVTATDADIIHTIGGLIPITPKPWMTTISMPSTFFGLNDEWHESRRRQWILWKALRSRKCRYVTCFSESTRKGLEAALGPGVFDDIGSKIKVLYPAIDPGRFVQKRKRDDTCFRILFIGNHFFDKGGRELHRAVSVLAKKYDVHLDLVTTAPPHHKEALESYMKHHQEDWVSWHVPGLPRKLLMDQYYPEADVFAMCSYMEVFGFVFLEAMACGLPIIGANVYAQREIIVDNHNGYLIDVPYCPFQGEPQLRTRSSIDRYLRVILDHSYFDTVVTQLVERLTTLIEDTSVRDRMSANSKKMTTEGRFSVRARNEILSEMYDSAVR